MTSFIKKLQKNTKDLFIKLQNLILVKCISAKRTFGNQRYFPRIQRDLAAYGLVLSPTGALTLVVAKKSNSSSKKRVKRTIKERFFAFVKQRARCRIMKQNSNLKRTYCSAMSTTIILSDARYTRDIYPKTYQILR